MNNITKRFGKVTALKDVNLEVKQGEVHALVGENGAGKSTLMNVLSGVYPYGTYEGDIIYDDETCKFNTIHDSEDKGIVIIHQELALVPYLSIAENMFLGNERTMAMSKNVIDWPRTYQRAKELLELVGLDEDPHTLIKDIGVGKQQLVEIAKAISKNCRLLILDEPTASLNETDSQKLLELISKFRDQGMTSIIISHKLNEISYIANSITVIRDGSTIETLDNTDHNISEDRIIAGMVGRALTDRFPKRSAEHKISDEVLLEVDNWNVYHPLNPNRKVNVVIDSKKYLTNLKSISEANATTAKPLNTFLDSIVRTNYTSPLQFQQPEPHPFTNPNHMTNNPQPSFIHGINDFGPFPPNTQIPFPYQPMPMNGNLVGPDNFIFRQPHPQVRYDPMSPFGSGFDFIPPQDGIGGNGFGAGGII